MMRVHLHLSTLLMVSLLAVGLMWAICGEATIMELNRGEADHRRYNPVTMNVTNSRICSMRTYERISPT
jgi:hypothetical protein